MISATAQVTPVTLVGRGVVYQAPLGTYSDVVGTFTDANLQAVPGGFVSTIQWGDGSTSAGIVAGRNGQFTVNGSHSYTKNAAYTVAVSVADSGGGSTSFTSTLYVGVTPPPSAGARWARTRRSTPSRELSSPARLGASPIAMGTRTRRFIRRPSIGVITPNPPRRSQERIPLP